MSTPVTTLRNLQHLYGQGFRDEVTDTALQKVVNSQIARDQITLRDLERDLAELEAQYAMPSETFHSRWLAGELDDSADFMDWHVLCEMVAEVRKRVALLKSEV
ncbi:MAG: hypothetical protein MUQ30_04060 [Anaerolineae bacterium]|nr:hypothetical protein [Anaerolineae bacterium]